MNDLLDISHKAVPVTVVGSGIAGPVDAFTDGQHFYFDDANVARIAEHLTGVLDLAGRPVRIERWSQGWQEQRGGQVRPLHQRHIRGDRYFRFDDEWLFTVVPSPAPQRTGQRSS